MTTLTKLVLNREHRSVHRDITDCNRLHKTVMSTVSPGAPCGDIDLRAQTGTLFRLDAGQSGEDIVLTVQSNVTPDVHCLAPGYTVEGESRTIDLDQHLDRIEQGQRIRYTLIAAPVRSLPMSGKKRGKKVPLTSPNEVRDWWHRTVDRIGIEIELDDLGNEALRVDPTIGARGKKGDQTVIRHRGYRIAGIGRVRDAEALRAAARKGVGPGKAYGMGLLTVVPVA